MVDSAELTAGVAGSGVGAVIPLTGQAGVQSPGVPLLGNACIESMAEVEETCVC